MKTFSRIALAIILTLTWQAQWAQGQTGDTISVVATGIGKDQDTALKNALRSAVEQAVGVLIDAETRINNDKVISDKILTFSAGFVESYELIGEPVLEGGLVSVRIAAKVKRIELKEELQRAAWGSRYQVSGAFIAAQVKSRQLMQDNGIARLGKMLEDYHASTTTMTGHEYDINTRKLRVDIAIKIDPKKFYEFGNEVSELLQTIIGGEITVEKKQPAVIENNRAVRYQGNIVPKGKGKGKFAIAENWYSFSSPREKETVNFTDIIVSKEFFEKIMPMFVRKNIVVELVDDSGNSLAVGKSASPTPYSLVNLPFNRPNDPLEFDATYDIYDGRSSILVFPALLDRNSRSFVDEYQQRIYVDISLGEAEKISEVLVRYEPVPQR